MSSFLASLAGYKKKSAAAAVAAALEAKDAEHAVAKGVAAKAQAEASAAAATAVRPFGLHHWSVNWRLPLSNRTCVTLLVYSCGLFARVRFCAVDE